MRRREFITLLGGVAAAWPLAARAQQPAKLPTIGYMGPNTPSVDSYRLPAFVQRIGELGWVEGRTVTIEYRWAEGRSERFTEIATEFVHRKVDLIVTGGAAVLAAKEATSVIPIPPSDQLTPDTPLRLAVAAVLAFPDGSMTA